MTNRREGTRADRDTHSYEQIAPGEWARKTSLAGTNETFFRELITVTPTTFIDIRPTWGFSDLRDLIFINGTLTDAANATSRFTEEGGELKIVGNTTANDHVFTETIERGQYISGAELDASAAARLSENIQSDSTQDIRWGYYNSTNGLGFGQDSEGFYLFELRDGVINKIRDFNGGGIYSDSTFDKDINLTDGHIFRINFSFYGYGNIKWGAYLPDTPNQRKEFVIHKKFITDKTNLIDPNMPLKAEIINGASPSSAVDLFVGGRKISTTGNIKQTAQRVFQENTNNFNVTSTSFRPFLALKKKETFGPSSRANSVRAVIGSFSVQADNSIDIFVTERTHIDPATITYFTPTGIPLGETAIEISTDVGDTQTWTVDNEGIRIIKERITTEKNVRTDTSKDAEEVQLSAFYDVVFWARKATNSDASVNIVFSWGERW